MGRHWRAVGFLIGLEKGQLDAIEYDEKSLKEQIVLMLNKWTHIYGNNSTINYLVTALKKIHQYDIAAKLPDDQPVR